MGRISKKIVWSRNIIGHETQEKKPAFEYISLLAAIGLKGINDMGEGDKKRIEEIDICKGIGILLVMMGHFQILGGMSIWVHAFYMPLFVLLSGFVYRKKDFFDLFRSLMIPYFTFGTLCIIGLDGIFRGGEDVKLHMIGLLCGGCAPNYKIVAASPLWYVSMIFVLQCIYSIMDDCIRKKVHLFVLCCILGALGWMLSIYRNKINMIYNIDIVLIMMPFFHLARMYGERVLNILKSKKWISYVAFVVLFSVSFVCSEMNGTVNVFNMVIPGNKILFYFNGVTGSCSVLCIAIFLSKCRMMRRISAVFSYLGRRTIILLPFHFPFAIGWSYIRDRYDLPFYAVYVFFMLALLISILISEIIMAYFPFFLGKKDMCMKRGLKGIDSEHI